MPPPSLGSAAGAKLYLGWPPSPPPRRGAGKRPRQPPLLPIPCRAAALGRPRGCPAGRRPGAKRGFPGAAGGRGGWRNGRRGDGAARGKPLTVFSPEKKPQAKNPNQPASRGGCQRDGEAAVQPRSHRARRRAEGVRERRPSAGAAQRLRAPEGPGGSLPPGREGSAGPGGTARLRRSWLCFRADTNKQTGKKTIPILNRFKTSSALSQCDGRFCSLFTKCGLSSSLERVDQAK